MAQIILPHRWQRQPQGPVTINPGLEFAADVEALWIPSYPVELATGRPAVAEGTPDTVSGPMGLATSLVKSDSEAYDLGARATADIDYTFGAIVKSSDINSFALATRTSSSANGFDILIGSGGVAGVNGVRVSVLTAPLTTGHNDDKFHHYTGIAQTINLNDIRGVYDGVDYGNTGTSGINTQATQNLYVGRRATTYFTGEIALAYVIKRALSVQRVQDLHADPWQLFRPLRRRLYFFATGAALAFEQEGFRWRYDDGDEDGATFSAAQDEHSAASIGIKKRLRALVNVTGTPSTEEFELQYRRVGSPTEDWRKVN